MRTTFGLCNRNRSVWYCVCFQGKKKLQTENMWSLLQLNWLKSSKQKHHKLTMWVVWRSHMKKWLKPASLESMRHVLDQCSRNGVGSILDEPPLLFHPCFPQICTAEGVQPHSLVEAWLCTTWVMITQLFLWGRHSACASSRRWQSYWTLKYSEVSCLTR